MKRAVILLVAVMCLLSQIAVSAEERAPLYPGFPAIRESKAYKKFATRTYSEFSKILYLIDRYSDASISINYEDQNYTAAFSTTVARWFLSRNYKKQTAREWIKQWCSKSIFANKPIYVKLPDEKFVLARDVLDAELSDLEQVVRENQVPPESLAPAVILTALPDESPKEPAPQASENPPAAPSASTLLKSSPPVTPLSAPAAETSAAKA